MITGVKYLSPTFDHSGYGEASRNCIKALLGENVPITLQRQAFEQTGPGNYGEYGAKLASMLDKNIPYTHKIMHCTPEHYVKYVEKSIKHVGFIYWETSRVPNEWVTWFNKYVDAQIVCCDYNKDTLIECGVKKPIFKLLPPFDMKDFENITPYQLEGVREDTFVFYSIFQWTERKNPMGLLLAYLTEFSGDEDVILVLKTYRSNTSMEEQNYIRKTIGLVKSELRMKSFPKIFFIGDLLTKDQVLGLHARGDCCVIPARCFVAGTEILTNKGLVPIEKINKGDTVLTHKGNYKKVINTFENVRAGRKLIEFKVSGSYEKFVATEDHKVFAIKLKGSDKRFPRGKCLTLSDVGKYRLSELNKGDVLVFPRHLRSDKRDKNKEDLALLYGYFLAEGCLGRRIRKNKLINEGIVFSIGTHETELYNSIVRLMRKFYGLEPHVQDRSRNRRIVSYYSRKLCDEYCRLFYSDSTTCNSHTKIIPFYFLNIASKHEVGNLIKGLFEGDGYKRSVHDSKGRLVRFIDITSVSKNLLVQCKRLLADIGVASGISYRGKTFSNQLNISGGPSYSLKVKGHHLNTLLDVFESDYGLGKVENSYTFQKVYEDFIAVKIREIKYNKSISRTVYGMEVEEDHSYCLSSFVSLNSEGLGMPHAEAMASGKPVIATKLGGHMEFMNEQNSYLVDYQLSPVYGMPWIPWYRGDQVWAEPNIMQIRQHMRNVYENRDVAKEVGARARETIKETLNMKKIGEEYVKILEQI